MKLPPGYVPGSGVHKASGFGGFGERLLRQQGWQTGEGLGKDKSGRAEAIAVKKKEDNVGVSGYLALPVRSHRDVSLGSDATCRLEETRFTSALTNGGRAPLTLP